MLFLKKQIAPAHKLPRSLAICSLAAAFVILVADTELSGLLWRYFNDFSLFVMFAALLSVWIVVSTKKMTTPSTRKWLITLLLLCFITEVLFQGMFFFVDTGSSLMDTRSDLYSRAMYLIAFWL